MDTSKGGKEAVLTKSDGTKETGAEESTAESNKPEKFCSACGRSGASTDLKKCTACKCVFYCDVSCQKSHRKEHKFHCKQVQTILAKRRDTAEEGECLGPLEEPPPREECPICMRVLPIEEELGSYMTCCGKILCSGCLLEQEKRLDALNAERTCAFCRTVAAKSPEEQHQRELRRMVMKDRVAILGVALNFRDGCVGPSRSTGIVPVDKAKSVELLRQAADLGSEGAHYRLGMLHQTGEMGVTINEAKAMSHYEEAAERGHVFSRHNLGVVAYGGDNKTLAMRHFRIAAAAGYGQSIDGLILCFEDAVMRHSDLAESLQARDRAQLEMKSEARDHAMAHLREKGMYEDLE
mmetsp:Transcript_22663/g.65256  ORF Transcript_22663/g.65256 Transcript_22663/m.65256 type:complete len:351 (+) Transcript_22663:161-1213(+)